MERIAGNGAAYRRRYNMGWPIFAAALLLTALMLACIWVASDADDYSENRREKDD